MSKITWAMLALLIATTANAQTPSFNCDDATTDDEIAICSDENLSNLDVLYANAYTAIKRDQGAKAARAFAAAIMAQRRACGADIACIQNVLEGALNSLEDQGSTVSSTSSLEDMILQWDQANGLCRGSNNAATIETYCRLRENLGQQLHALGLCEGNYLFDNPDFKMATILREKWIPCLYRDLQ